MAARKQFLLRVDPELWKELEKWAADELRSVNAQVEWVLRDAMKKRKGGRRRRSAAVARPCAPLAGRGASGSAARAHASAGGRRTSTARR